jgi:prevent-host-death family protein
MATGEVSVRELRQNLSVYLRRVEEGATLTVTNRGERVAVLGPIGGGSRVDRLIAEGRIREAETPYDDFEPLDLDDDGGPTLTQILQKMRDEDDR